MWIKQDLLLTILQMIMWECLSMETLFIDARCLKELLLVEWQHFWRNWKHRLRILKKSESICRDCLRLILQHEQWSSQDTQMLVNLVSWIKSLMRTLMFRTILSLHRVCLLVTHSSNTLTGRLSILLDFSIDQFLKETPLKCKLLQLWLTWMPAFSTLSTFQKAVDTQLKSRLLFLSLSKCYSLRNH